MIRNKKTSCSRKSHTPISAWNLIFYDKERTVYENSLRYSLLKALRVQLFDATPTI